MSKTIALVSGKGGVGKTTLAINIAYSLIGLKEDALLVDANLTNPHIGLHLGEGKFSDTLHDVLMGKTSFAKAVYYHQSGIKMVPGALNTPTITSAALLSKFSKAASWVLFDAGNGSQDHVLDHAKQVLIVTTPQLPSLVEAYKLLQKAKDEQITVAGVILNKNTRHGVSISEAEKFLGTSFAAVIPHDEHIYKALNKKMPFSHLYPRRSAARSMQQLAARLANKPWW